MIDERDGFADEVKEREDRERITAFVENLEAVIVDKYPRHLEVAIRNMFCEIKAGTVVQLGKEVCNIDFRALKSACTEMKTDVKFLIERRGELIGEFRPSFGKMAGIVAYRLAKSQIIHLNGECASCKKPCVATRLNQEIALWCAYDYIGIKYRDVPEERNRELFYSFSCRHVNQETLGLVFDAFWGTYAGKQQKLGQ